MKQGQRGANLVEFAVVVPLLLLLLAGIVDLGRAFYGYIVISNATREAARYGTRLPNDTLAIRSKALTEITNSGAVPTVIRIESCQVPDPARVADLDGWAIQVSVQCAFDPLLPFIADFSVGSSVRMKIEGPSWGRAPAPPVSWT